MKKILFFLTTFLFILISAECAHSQTEVYSNGNVKILQLSDGWQVLHGNNVIAHGDGTLDVGNLPPMFKDFLEYYAKKEISSKKKLSKSATSNIVWGPYLKTKWNQNPTQTDPTRYNDDFPVVSGYKQKDNGNVVRVDNQLCYAGCSTISTAQVLNYYRFCNPIYLYDSTWYTDSTNYGVTELSSNYFSNLRKEGNQIWYDYNFAYEPNFDAINSNEVSLAKFLMGVALAQKAKFGVSGTGTSVDTQIKALNDCFGYICECYPTENEKITSLSYNSIIENSIKKGMPIIISGRVPNAKNGHSFVVDGYDEKNSQFHVNFGWGGNHNDFYMDLDDEYLKSENLNYTEKLKFIIARPNDSHSTFMQRTPKYVHILGSNGFEKTVEMVTFGDNDIAYKQKDDIELTPGIYEFYFEYADGSTLAPYTDRTIVLSKNTNPYVNYGRYVTTAAKFELSDAHKLNFIHTANKSEIKIDILDYDVEISGKVVDKNSQAIQNVCVTSSENYPIGISTQTNENGTKTANSYIYTNARTNSTAKFTANGKMLTSIAFQGWVTGNPGSLYIEIMNANNEIIYSSALGKNGIYKGWTNIDVNIPVNEGAQYSLELRADKCDVNGGNYYACYNYDNQLAYRASFSECSFAYTDNNGNYTYPVDKNWTGTLHAYYNSKKFNNWNFNNLSKSVSDINFVENGTDQTYTDNDKATSLTVVIPEKVDYTKGEDFDKKGLKVFANYGDGTKKEITDYEVTGFNSKTNGEKYVTVNYDGLSARFKVFVGQSYPSYRRHINLEQEMSGGSLPSKVDLTQYLPPVKSQWWLYDDNGNQLSYNGKLGTCLAWAFGYYNRTYLRAKNLNLSKTDLEKPENQFSPKDLYMVISAGQKTWSQGLNGTETMDMLSTRGIASMKTVPYRNFEDSVYLRDNELIEAEAAEYKITSYDQIVSGFTKNAIKSALNKGHLIVFSANIGTDFKKGYGNKNSSHAMPYANYDFTSTGRHVMTICGYDDSKGEHGAFKVVNSYGPDWCEDGFIWIDQDFFTDNYAITDSKGNALGFCNYYAYIMHANDRVVSSLTAKNDITTYYVGDEFNKSGLTVTANYSDGSSATVSDYELSGFDSKTTGTKTITVSYKGKSTTFQITVKENNSNLHSITYIVDGEVYMSLKKMVVHGSRMIMTNDPSKVGYTFDGWFTEDGKRYNFETGIVNDDVTLYAHWTPIEYTITYNLDGGILTQNNPESYTIESFNIILNNPTKEGYIFMGWTGTDLNEETFIVWLEQGSTGNRQYTANWEKMENNRHTITYIVDGEIHMQLKNAVVHGSKMILTNDPEKAGYSFDGWFTADGRRYDFATGIVNNDITLYAHWNIVNYAITYDLDGGTLSKNNPDTYTVESVNFTLTNPTKDGYTFIGWTGTDLYGKSMSVTIEQGSIGNREYVANWERKKQNLHSVTYIVDGEIYMQLKNIVVHGSSMIMTNDPEKDGYSFDGWFTADGERYNFATGIVNDDVTLYAHWNVANYSITYYLDGGNLSNSNPISYTIETDDFTLNNPSKENYLFLGWTGTDLPEPTKEVTIAKGSIGNRQYTANWKRLFTLTFIVDDEVYYSLGRISYGSNVPRTTEPKKEGYVFDEWYNADGTRFNFATTVFTDDITLYAHWKPIEYSITYDLDGGMLTNNNPATYTIETENFELNNPTKEGFEFVGWTGTDLTTASNNVVIRKGSTGDRDYVAVWKESKGYIHPEHNYNAYITGKVLDANNNPLENALVTSGNSIPQIMVGSTGSMTDQGYYIMDDWSSIEFTATKKFLTKVDVLLNISGDPGKICIAIANHDDYNIIWGRMFYQERITNNDWTSIDIDDIIEVVPGQKYYLSFKADTYNLDERTYYAVFEDSNTEPMYKIWGNDDPVVRTDSEGDYYFPFEDNWSGTLRAFYTDKKFNKLSFSKVISSIDGMDFIENSADKTFNETLPQRHTIKYIVDGKIHMQLQNAVVHGSRMILTNDPEKGGYVFDGWYTADGKKYDFATGIVNSDVTLYAHWNIIEYSIAYILDGGELSQTNPKSLTVETSDFTLNNPTKTGYTFVGWTGTGLANATTTVKINKGSTGDKTYTAKWKINQYTITFDTDGGTKLDAITAEYGKKITQSKNPAKEGYTFAGWDYLPETMPARNITAKAQWNINAYKLTYYVDNEPYGETESVYFGTKLTQRTEPSKIGYSFSGWHNLPTTMPGYDVVVSGTFRVNTYTLTYIVDGNVYGETETVAYGTEIILRDVPTKEGYTFSGWSSHPDLMPDRDLTIRGSFEVNKHKVTYVYDGATYRESNVDFGSVIPSITAPTKIGYAFAGWSPELPATMPDYDIKVTAQWKPNQYTITFDTDGGTEVSNITADFGSSIKKPDNPTKVGYTFDGWYPEIPSVMNSDLTCKAYWKVNSYTITFNTEGGTTVSNITNYYGSKVSKPADPTKKGYTFGGWKPEIPTTMPAEDMTVSAVWLEADQYTVTFDTDGGNYIPCIVGYAGEKIPSISNPAKEGYTFNGWDRQIPSAIPSENITITATWKVNQYTLSFDTDGGNTISSIKVDYGSKIPSVTNPTKIGHTFDGWNIDLTALTMPANNLTVKALWKKEQYSVTFDTDGGNYIAPIKADYGAEVAAPQKPSKEGYEFDGWSVNFPTRITSDLTVTAKWRVKKYTITFDTDGGTEISTITQDFGTTIATPTAPTKAGYTFGGWTPQLPITMPAQNVNVTAIWLRDNQYKITFDTDGGSSVTSGAYYFGETISVPTNPIKTGYTFVGWNPAIPSTMPAENLTVKAQWKAIEYTITFDTDGGNAIAPITTYYGAEINAPSTNPKKEGCTFDGWNYDFPFTMPANNLTIKAKWKGGIYKVQFDDFSFELAYGAAIPKINEPQKEGYTFIGWDGKVPETMPAKDLVFKSQWSVNQYTIVFDTDGGSEIMPVKVDFGSTVIAPEQPSKDGYVFNGWSRQFPFIMPSENLIVKALWNKNKHSLTYMIDGKEDHRVELETGAVIHLDSPTITDDSFNGWQCEWTTMPDHDITANGSMIRSIAILTLPTNIEYANGNITSVTGGKIRLTYVNGTTKDVDFTKEMIESYDIDAVHINYLGCKDYMLVTAASETKFTDKDIHIWSFENVIYVENAKSEIKIVDVNGRVIKTVKPESTRMEIPIEKMGIYIVKTFGATNKVFIK